MFDFLKRKEKKKEPNFFEVLDETIRVCKSLSTEDDYLTLFESKLEEKQFVGLYPLAFAIVFLMKENKKLKAELDILKHTNV